MALTRKKQDEKNLKTLRELVSLPHNKHCFDCNQRGPTYVNVTIGSFVCTKCSGMLRGLTPPHRVKSISMATFTPDEIEFVRSRGNDYCHRAWLGLFEGTIPSDRDENSIHTLMLDKYERKRYYMEPSVALRNGHNKPTEPVVKTAVGRMITTSIIPEPRPARIVNGEKSNRRDEFIADFAHADIFNGSNNNGQGDGQASFANFDNNPIFSSENTNPMNINIAKNTNAVEQQSKTSSQAPSEDRYAALKDLDNALKSQPAVDWNTAGSNSSLYSSPTAAGSVYSSNASPLSSSYGSPSQGQFMNLFSPQEPPNSISNPFNGNGGLWNGNRSQNTSNGVNPFRASPDAFSISNGGNYQSMFPGAVNGSSAWPQNPFKVVNSHSSNPFL